MSNRHRDEGGRFTEEMTEQEILKAFDFADEPILTSSELARQFDVTPQAVTYRLKQMHESGLVGRKRTGSSAVAWWAEAAPELSKESAFRVQESREAFDRGEGVPLEEA